MYINIILLRVSERITCMCFGYMHTKTFQKRCISLNVSQSESESYISHYPRTLTFKLRNNINMFSFVRHSDRSKFSERTTCLHIRGLSIAVFMCTICTRVQIFTREQIYTRVQICTPLCRVHMPINCVHTHQDLIRNLTQGTHFYEKFAVFECCK